MIKEKNSNKNIIHLCLRYIILLIIALNLNIIYEVFIPLTLYLSNFLINIFYQDSYISNSSIFIGNLEISLISACIAGSAYLLLIILNLSTEMKFKTRLKALSFTIFFFLIINCIRIAFLTYLLKTGINYFDFAHKLSWYLGSTLFLVIIWFTSVKLFKIDKIPVFTDVKYLISEINKKKKN